METLRLSPKIKYFYCEFCDYSCSEKQRYQRHCQSKNHFGNIVNASAKPEIIKTQNNKNYEHNDVSINNNIIDTYDDGNQGNASAKLNSKIEYSCCCGKIYANRSGLWKHKKICNVISINSNNNSNSNINNITPTEKKNETNSS